MTVYSANPLDVAKEFENHGLSRLHLVDLDGAKASKIVNWKVLEQITSATTLKVDFGGGIKSDDDLRIAFECGAKQITGGSIAVKKPEIFENWIRTYGSDKIILGADAKNEQVAVSGWLETSELNVIDFIKGYMRKGVKYCISTDIAKDGMLQGASHDLYERILNQTTGLHLIASGGVTTMSEIEKLAENGLYGAIIGKAIYENKISLKDLEKFALNHTT